jgi:hypothetical protein
MLTKQEQRALGPPAPTAVAIEAEELRAAAQRQVKRVRRLKINVAAWSLGTILFTALWVLIEWQDNGALTSFGHEGEAGQWNPTLWALAVGIWGLIVGIMALRVHFERPAMPAEVDREVDRQKLHPTAKNVRTAELRRFARSRLERIRRLRFHVAAWVLGLIVLTPLWALIEWQDNGGFERFSNNSQPGNWEPWILYVGGIWALAIAVFALQTYFERPTTEAEIERELKRLRSR